MVDFRKSASALKLRNGSALSREIRDRARVRGLIVESRLASGNSLDRPGAARGCIVDLRKLSCRRSGEFAT